MGNLHDAGLIGSHPLKTAEAGTASIRIASRKIKSEGGPAPLTPDPTLRFTIFFARELSLVSLSHVRGAVHTSVPGFVTREETAVPLIHPN